jgi:hypothetical protein
MICKAVLGWLPDDLCYWAQRMRQFASNVSVYLEMLGIRLLSSCPAKRTTTIDSCKMRRQSATRKSGKATTGAPSQYPWRSAQGFLHRRDQAQTLSVLFIDVH